MNYIIWHYHDYENLWNHGKTEVSRLSNHDLLGVSQPLPHLAAPWDPWVSLTTHAVVGAGPFIGHASCDINVTCMGEKFANRMVDTIRLTIVFPGILWIMDLYWEIESTICFGCENETRTTQITFWWGQSLWTTTYFGVPHSLGQTRMIWVLASQCWLISWDFTNQNGKMGHMYVHILYVYIYIMLDMVLPTTMGVNFSHSWASIKSGLLLGSVQHAAPRWPWKKILPGRHCGTTVPLQDSCNWRLLTSKNVHRSSVKKTPKIGSSITPRHNQPALVLNNAHLGVSETIINWW